MAEKKMKLSVAMATFNEEKNLDGSLGSVKDWVDEIILVDGGSTDRSVAIANKYGATVMRTDNPPIFHINKQKALDACHGDWILQLDADEVVDEPLRDEILGVINRPNAKDAYYLPRKNFFVGHWLSKGGQYPDYLVRLFRNGAGMFPNKSVHEQIAVSGKTGYLTKPLLHYTNRTFADYWRKADTYTTLTAKELSARHAGKNPLTFVNYMVVKPLWTFLRLFIRHKGFVDGIWGFQFALYSGFHHAIAYWKYLTNAA
jgi:glycosyltransferase involved in cell wall biosynthesis